MTKIIEYKNTIDLSKKDIEKIKEELLEKIYETIDRIEEYILNYREDIEKNNMTIIEVEDIEMIEDEIDNIENKLSKKEIEMINTVVDEFIEDDIEIIDFEDMDIDELELVLEDLTEELKEIEKEIKEKYNV